jgi:molybdate transport repressor ModE-like protein
LLDETRRILGTDVIATHAGGADRGGAALTEAGRNLITVYERVCEAAAKAAQSELESLTFAEPQEAPVAPGPRRKRKAKTS